MTVESGKLAAADARARDADEERHAFISDDGDEGSDQDY